MSSAAKVTPREATDSSATREVISTPRLPTTMMAARRYSTSRTPERMIFCTRASSLEADSSRRISFKSSRTATRQTTNTITAVKISPTEIFPTEADSRADRSIGGIRKFLLSIVCAADQQRMRHLGTAVPPERELHRRR